MKFVLFHPDERLGLLVGDQILDVRQAVALSLMRRRRQSDLVETVASLKNLIEAGARGLDLVRTAAQDVQDVDATGLRVSASDAKLAAPFPGQRLMMAGVNFADHVSDYLTHMGQPLTPEVYRAKARAGDPTGFWSVARPIMGPGAKIQIPTRAGGYFDYEAEPAIVLGRAGKDVKFGDFHQYLWGVSIVADWTIREEWPAKPANGLMVRKNFDQSKSMGPCIVVDEAIDVNDIHLCTKVNGEVRQAFSSAGMIFSFAEMLEFVSRDFTVLPGDVMTGGTDKGTVIDTITPNPDGTLPIERFLRPGDIVEMESPRIGLLRSEIVAKAT
jgi:2-keto-4-pentenoate hydratase/2-oxohepta-3-ene-1,7-dioic acid hydratase in catechol pathway